MTNIEEAFSGEAVPVLSYDESMLPPNKLPLAGEMTHEATDLTPIVVEEGVLASAEDTSVVAYHVPDALPEAGGFESVPETSLSGWRGTLQRARTKVQYGAMSAGLLMMGISPKGHSQEYVDKVRAAGQFKRTLLFFQHEPMQVVALASRLLGAAHTGVSGFEHFDMASAMPSTDHVLDLAGATHMAVSHEVQVPDMVTAAYAHDMSAADVHSTLAADSQQNAHLSDVYATGSGPAEDLHYVKQSDGVAIKLNLTQGQTFIEGHQVDLATLSKNNEIEASITAKLEGGKTVTFTVPLKDGQIVVPDVAARAVEGHNFTIQAFSVQGDKKWIFSTAVGNGHVFTASEPEIQNLQKLETGNTAPTTPVAPTTPPSKDLTVAAVLPGNHQDRNEYEISYGNGHIDVELPNGDIAQTGEGLHTFAFYDPHAHELAAIPESDMTGMLDGGNRLTREDQVFINNILAKHSLRIVSEQDGYYQITSDSSVLPVSPKPNNSEGERIEADVALGAVLLLGVGFWLSRRGGHTEVVHEPTPPDPIAPPLRPQREFAPPIEPQAEESEIEPESGLSGDPFGMEWPFHPRVAPSSENRWPSGAAISEELASDDDEAHTAGRSSGNEGGGFGGLTMGAVGNVTTGVYDWSVDKESPLYTPGEDSDLKRSRLGNYDPLQQYVRTFYDWREDSDSGIPDGGHEEGISDEEFPIRGSGRLRAKRDDYTPVLLEVREDGSVVEVGPESEDIKEGANEVGEVEHQPAPSEDRGQGFSGPIATERGEEPSYGAQPARRPFKRAHVPSWEEITAGARHLLRKTTDEEDDEEEGPESGPRH